MKYLFYLFLLLFTACNEQVSNQNIPNRDSSLDSQVESAREHDFSFPDFVKKAKQKREKQNNTIKNTDTEKDHFLLGNHVFGVQFIWDGYGVSEFYFEGEKLIFLGEQLSANAKDFLFLYGEVSVINKKKFVIDGKIAINISDCTGYQMLEGKFTFLKSGKRKYWRMQNPEKELLSDKYTCHYYIDIFEHSSSAMLR